MKVMVTGHRPERLKGKELEVAKWLDDQLRELQPNIVISGMASGTDQIFAELALRQNIGLAAALPYKREFDTYHPAVQDMLLKAKEVVYAKEKYSKSAYYERDKIMVDATDIVLAVYDGNPIGGTYLTIEYAKEQGKEIRYFPWVE